MKKTVTFTYEEERAVVDALIEKLTQCNRELEIWEAGEKDYSTSIERQLCAGRLADGIKDKINLLSGILDRMATAGYDFDEEEEK